MAGSGATLPFLARGAQPVRRARSSILPQEAPREIFFTMATQYEVKVEGLHPKAPSKTLLGPGNWTCEAGVHCATLDAAHAADLRARLQGLTILGAKIQVRVHPSLARRDLRAALTRKAHALRDTTPGFLKKNTRMDEQGRYSLTPEALAMAMANKNPCAEVWDLGCGVGGNAIAFARCGAKVHAVELDAQRAAMARHNCKVYGVSHRVDVHCANALDLLPERVDGLVFCDPPWGRDFKQRPSELSGYPLAQQLWASRRRFAQLWLKLPASFDPRTLTGLGESKVRIQIYFGKAKGDARSPKFMVVRAESITR